MVALACFAGAGRAAYLLVHAHVFLTVTPSMPAGLYWLTPNQPAERGDVAIACVPNRFAQWALAAHVLAPDARCDGVEPVLKRVVAVGGDRVRISKRGVFVNGRYQAGSRRMTSLNGRPIPAAADNGEIELKRGETLLLGDNRSASFDGRYFGPTDRVLGRAAIILPL